MHIMHGYYIGVIASVYTKERETVEREFKKIFHQDYSIEVLQTLSEDHLQSFCKELKKTVQIESSLLSVKDIKQILLAGETSNMGLQAFTEYTCARCGVEGMWHNSDVPLLCDRCRSQSAMNIIMSGILHKLL